MSVGMLGSRLGTESGAQLSGSLWEQEWLAEVWDLESVRANSVHVWLGTLWESSLWGHKSGHESAVESEAESENELVARWSEDGSDTGLSDGATGIWSSGRRWGCRWWEAL